MSKTLTLPPPYKGQYDRTPVATIQSPYAEIVENYNLDSGTPTVRNGDRIFNRINSFADLNVLDLMAYGDTALFAITDPTSTTLTIYDVTTGVASLVYTPAAGGDDFIFHLYFNKYLFVFGDVALAPGGAVGPLQYNGTAWGVATYVWPANFKPAGGAVYKNRAYFVDTGNADCCYSTDGGVSGTLTRRSMAGLISRKANLYGIRSFTLAEGAEQDAALAFIFDSGEVLVYRGLYPDAPDWRIAGRFFIGKPAYYHAFADAEGDSYVITNKGIVSLRGLYTTGITAAREGSLSWPISTRWKEIYDQMTLDIEKVAIRGVYDSKRDRLIISFAKYVARTTDTRIPSSGDDFFRLVYSFQTQSWAEHFGAIGIITATPPAVPIRVLCYEVFRDIIHYGTTVQSVVYQVEQSNSFTDNAQAPPYSGSGRIAYRIRTAPLPLPINSISIVRGVELIVAPCGDGNAGDYEGRTLWVKLIGDMGAVITAPQMLYPQVAYTTWGAGPLPTKPFFDVGIEAGICQLEIDGKTDLNTSSAFQLLALNAWYDQGGLR